MPNSHERIAAFAGHRQRRRNQYDEAAEDVQDDVQESRSTWPVLRAR